jgi:hypothetical protein
MFLLNSRLDPFSVTLPHMRTHTPGYPFSRSYGARLPSSLTRVFSITLGLPSLPTRVGLRYGRSHFNDNEAFLDGMGSTESYRVSPQLSPTFSYNIQGGFTCPGLTYSGRHTMSIRYAQSTLPCPPFVSVKAVRE